LKPLESSSMERALDKGAGDVQRANVNTKAVNVDPENATAVQLLYGFRHGPL
jgi:hypothetical protein